MNRQFFRRHLAFITALPLILASTSLFLTPLADAAPASSITVTLNTPSGDTPAQVANPLASGDMATATLSDTQLYAGQVGTLNLSITAASTPGNLASGDTFSVSAPSSITLSPAYPISGLLGDSSSSPPGMPTGEHIATELTTEMNGVINVAPNTSSGSNATLNGNTTDNLIMSIWSFTAPSTPGQYNFTVNFGSGNTQTLTLTVDSPPSTYQQSGTTYNYAGVASSGSVSGISVLAGGSIALPTTDTTALNDFEGYLTGSGMFATPIGTQPLTTSTVTVTYTPSGSTTPTTTPIIVDSLFQPYSVAPNASSSSLNEAILANSAGQSVLNSLSTNPAIQAYSQPQYPESQFAVSMGNAATVMQPQYTYVLPASSTTTSSSTTSSSSTVPTQTVTATVTVPGPTHVITQTQTQTQTQTSTVTNTQTQTDTSIITATTTLPQQTVTKTVTPPPVTKTVTLPAQTVTDTVTAPEITRTVTTTKTDWREIHAIELIGQNTPTQAPTTPTPSPSNPSIHSQLPYRTGIAWWWLVVEALVLTGIYALITWLRNRHRNNR